MKIRTIAVLAGTAIAATLMTSAAAQASTTNTTIRPADLLSGYSGTGTAGHVDFLKDGLHVYTDDATGNAKAAEYWAASGPLPTSGQQTWYGTDPAAGMQIIFDANGAAEGDGYNTLVGEKVYGVDGSGNYTDWWLTNGSSADAKIACPLTTGGSGSACHGTLADWKSALPDATVEAYGFSLGSGIKGDGVLETQTYGATTYDFSSEAPAVTPAPPVVTPTPPVVTPTPPVVAPKPVKTNVTGHATYKRSLRHAHVDLYTNRQPANTTMGKALNWVITVDGKHAMNATLGFSEHSTWAYTFARRTGVHHVGVLENGVVVRSFSVNSGR